MELFCLGLNHRTAPVEVREKFAVALTQLGSASKHLLELDGISEAVVISTCNRTEFFIASPAPPIALASLNHFLSEKTGHSLDFLHHHFYQHQAFLAARHLACVVSGLDSMVLGETEIFGQIKQAYAAALENQTTAVVLNKAFQQAFRIGKKVRTETKIQEGSTSVGNVAVDLAEKIFGHLKNSEVIVLGAGEMSRITAQSLVSRGAKSIFVANRSFDRAQELAAQMGGRAVKFDAWHRVLSQVDVVISSTGAPHAIVHAHMIEEVRRARRYRPLFLIDIAVPRDIDPACGEIEEVYLYDIDTLEQLADEARAKRKLQIRECELIIDHELEKCQLPGTSHTP
ncbi:MAG: glutamyl-tRNA reductase [Verrucomicrobia bacterium]|nr:MAG: glutamyl-tRNA reductase [Verrucomicrobiota bacterium]